MFIFNQTTPARLYAPLCGDLVRELWNGFCCTCGELELTAADELCFRVGKPPEVTVAADRRYAIAVSEAGVLVRAHDAAGLMQGMLELMRLIKPLELEGDVRFGIPCGVRQDSADIGVRMAHLCVFPETPFDYLHKTVRLCAALHYTHLIIEFWGTFPFTCMPELAWPGVPTREQFRALADEIRLLGMEPVPMFNHLGHASASREMCGKHVVLDQNPAMAMYFAEDGWTWAIDDPRVHELFRQIRAELYDVFGEGEYIHLGFDEAYLYGTHPELADSLREFLCALTREVLDVEGRRPIIWGDMLLNHGLAGTQASEYSCNCHDPAIAEAIFAALDRRVIIADWQYRRLSAPVATTPYFASLGFDVLCCPWDKLDNIRACIDTVRTSKVMGVMETTWHTLSGEMGFAPLYACAEWCRTERAGEKMTKTFLRPAAAMLARKAFPGFAGYAKTGWVTRQVQV